MAIAAGEDDDSQRGGNLEARHARILRDASAPVRGLGAGERIRAIAVYDQRAVKFIWLACVAAEILAYLCYPRALAAVGWLPLFRPRLVTPDASWSALLRSVDPRGAAYRAPARTDLAPLAGTLGLRDLSTRGAEAQLSADGRLAIVRAHCFMPFVSLVPFCLVARMSLDDRDASIAVRGFGYPLFSLSAAFAALASVWFGPTPDTPALVAICSCVWLAIEVFTTRPRVRDVLVQLEHRLTSPQR
jgi:hypothetical protein